MIMTGIQTWAGTGSAFLTCETSQIEFLILRVSGFQTWAGTGSAFLTCEVMRLSDFFGC